MRLRSSFIVLALTLLAAACGGSNSGGSNLTLNTGPAPWPNPDNVADRIDAAGLPSSSTESLTVHYHSHVDIFVDGKSEPVASSIGREDQSLFSPLHTHATSGLIHIEAPEEQDFTVGMLFTEWGVRLTNDCIGGYCSPDTKLDGLRGRHEVHPTDLDHRPEEGRGDRDRDRLAARDDPLELGLSGQHRPYDREPGAVRRLRPAGPCVNRIGSSRYLF